MREAAGFYVPRSPGIVTGVVATTPAQFGGSQLQGGRSENMWLKRYARRSNEPSTVAVTHGTGEETSGERGILTFDLGG